MSANLYITSCPHGLDLRVHPRCYLCKPATPEPPLDGAAEDICSYCQRPRGEHVGEDEDCPIPEPPLDGAARIARERRRQVEEEGYGPLHDDGQSDSLALAAACYACPPDLRSEHMVVTRLWPWSPDAWKPTSRLRELEKAGALIAAAIDAEQRRQERVR